MLTLAVTGGIGSGKSLAGEIFADLGAIVVDSDLLSHQVIERGEPGFDEVIARFGDFILSNGEIDRKKLAGIIFRDESARKDLEAIIHPLVRSSWEKIVKQASSDAVLVNLIPLLTETQGKERFDLSLNIQADMPLRIARLKERGMYLAQIEARIAKQANDQERVEYCDFTIHNNGTKSSFADALKSFWNSEIEPRLKG